MKTEQERTATSLTSLPLNTGNSNSSAYFNTAQKGSRFQQLITASELLAAGIQAGDIQGMILDILNSGSNGSLLNPKISIKSTTDGVLTSFQTTGFLEVLWVCENGCEHRIAECVSYFGFSLFRDESMGLFQKFCHFF